MTGPRVVDLSLTLSPELPGSWPGALPFRHYVEHWFEEQSDDVAIRMCGSGAPYRSHALILDEHTGTHFDAPAHFLAPPGSGLPSAHPYGALTGDRIDPEQFIGPACVIDVRHLVGSTEAGVSPRIDVDLVEAWEAEHGDLTAGDIVLFRADWDSHYAAGADGDRYIRQPLDARTSDAWPAPSPETMVALAERGVRCVGTDGASMGPADDGAPTHLAGLERGMVFVECLAQLARLPIRAATFIFLPIKVARSAGGPGRAIGLISA